MLLAIDVGNTQTVFGLFEADVLEKQFRVGTNPAQTADELAVLVRSLIDLDTVEGIVMCSSVPQLVREYEGFAERWAGVDLLVLGPGVSTGVPIRYDDPREVGPDRIANAVAARERHGAPCVVVDFGTSTNWHRRRLGRRRGSRAEFSRLEWRSRWRLCSRGPRGYRRCRSSRRSG